MPSIQGQGQLVDVVVLSQHLCKYPISAIVVVSPYTSIIQATATDLYRIAAEVTHDGYNVAILAAQNAMLDNVLAHLSCPNVKGLYYVGHGSSDAITLCARPIESALVELTAKDLKKANLYGKLSSKIIEFNSCNTFNGNLRQAFADAGAKNYIAGKSYLSIGWSDNTSELF